MPVTILNTKSHDYDEAVIEFLSGIEKYKVDSLLLVAMVDDPEVHNICESVYSCPDEIAAAAGVGMLYAQKLMMRDS